MSWLCDLRVDICELQVGVASWCVTLRVDICELRVGFASWGRWHCELVFASCELVL